ncbi:MAG TPA: histidinol-phosphatase [Desulfobacteria bacterium]|nr:histidinol-phosphatase [Desulfobacteria bacterium]
MPVDYHIHTKMCGHASGEMEEYVEAAMKKGLKEIGFSDHIPMYFLPAGERDASIAMAEEQLPVYTAKVKELQKKYSGFPIKLGIEADYVPGMEQEASDILSRYEFDYCLGSIHFIDGWGFDQSRYIAEYEKWDLYELYERYFGILGQAAASGLFDTLSHPDLIKKLGFRPEGDLTPLYKKTVKIIADSGVCVEINTAGLRVPAAELYPAAGFLRLCCDAGVSVTLGSDAHKPEQVGAGFAEALALLKDVGYTKVVTFTGRGRNYCPI